MTVLREGDKTKLQREKRIGNLKDYTLKHRVTVEWDLNEDSMRDRMFRLTVDDKDVILDVEELMRYLRWI